MSGLELPAFIVGLSGLTAIFDRGIAIWRTVRDARGYGRDIVELLCMLEMEFSRFELWWKALQRLARIHTRPQPSPQHSRLQLALLNDHDNPITNAAEQILAFLEDIERILHRNGALDVVENQLSAPTSAASGHTLAEQEVTLIRSRRAKLAKDLVKQTSWFARATYTTSPWKQSDKDALKKDLDDIIYWNDALYGILPSTLRDSILQLGIAGYIFQTPEDLQSLFTHPRNRDHRIRQSASLLLNRQQLYQASSSGPMAGPDTGTIGNALKGTKLSIEVLRRLQPKAVNNQYSILDYVPQPGRVLVEWYRIPHSSQAKKLAERRLAQLAYLLGKDRGGPSLLALDCLGFIEYADAQHFGLLSALPQGKTTRTEPETLFNLITHTRPKFSSPGGKSPIPVARLYALPSLMSRYKLAAALAQSLYTFMLSRWHHEQFNSLHIAFLVERPIDEDSHKFVPLDISSPIVGGFVVSRPDSLNEPSISADLTDHEQLYLHPTLRNAKTKSRDTEMPRFQRAHEIYSFGLLLAEIGFWNSISRVAELGAKQLETRQANGTVLTPKDFKDAVVKMCQTDLTCWMGEMYRDVAVYCLTIEEAGDDEAEDYGLDNLDNFYWDVVMRLLESPLGPS
ncbi:prion-inhibition and propagation-domain-containing protein [Aspergillus terricola var. indicus]